MCRGSNEKNSRRCDCDSSENRRLRRYNAAARTSYSSLVNTTDYTTFSTSLPKPYFADGNHSLDSVNREIKLQIAKLPKLLLEGEHWGQHVIVEGKSINHAARAVRFDRIVSILGEGVDFIATHKYDAPTNEQFRSSYEALLKKHREKIRQEGYKARAQGFNEEQVKNYVDDIMREIRPERVNLIGNLLDKRNEALQSALRDVGVIFTDPRDSQSFEYSKESDQKAINSLKAALQFYPQNWVNASNELNLSSPLLVRSISSRAYYAGERPIENNKSVFALDFSELCVSEDKYSYFRANAGMRVALHEFGHRIEQVVGGVNVGRFQAGGISTAEIVFLSRRTGRSDLLRVGTSHLEGEQLSKIYPKRPDLAGEVGYKDNFSNHYMGRAYGEYSNPNKKFAPRTEAWEVFTMGMETLFAGTNGAFAGIDKTNTRDNYEQADMDYKWFILGLIASSARPDRRN